MSFIQKTLRSEEHLIAVARAHWIYAAKGFAVFLALYFMGPAAEFLVLTAFSPGPALAEVTGILAEVMRWIGLAVGGMVFVIYFLMCIATELGLTTHRLILKKGLIFVDVQEVELEEVKGAYVDHGLLGSILDYGYVRLDSRFIKDASLPAIASPYKFLKALNHICDHMDESDSLEDVLGSNEEKKHSKKKSQSTETNDQPQDNDEEQISGPVVFEDYEQRHELREEIDDDFKKSH